MLAQLEIAYPMMFRLSNPAIPDLVMHCGVMEFSAEEGFAYIPYWIMEALALEEGAKLDVLNVTLRKGTSVTLQPNTYKFAELANPRAVLERALRGYATLTKGSTIKIVHVGEVFYLEVVDLKPDNAVLIIETDMNVEFAPPKDNAEYEAKLAALRAANAAKAASSAGSTTATSPGAGGATGGTESKSPLAGGTSGTGAIKFGTTTVGGSTPTSTSSSTTPSSMAGDRASYFARLGTGYSLKSGGPVSTPMSTSTSTSTSTPVSPPPSNTSTSSSTSTSSIDASTKPSDGGLTVEVAGKWAYYKDAQGRLVKRVPASEVSKTFSPFAGQGNSLRK